MAGFHPGDPYYLVGGNNGWIDEDSKAEVPMEDPVGQPEEDPQEPQQEEDPEEDPEEQDAEGKDEELEEEEDMDEDLEADPPANSEEYESEQEELDVDMDDPMVVDEHHLVRSRDEPFSPPSHQVYWHPNGPRWMYTPRRKVFPIPRRNTFLIFFSCSGRTSITHSSSGIASSLGDTAPYMEQRAGSAHPIRQVSGVLDLSFGTSVDRALPVMVSRVSRLGNQLQGVSNQVLDVGAEARVTSVRVDHIIRDGNVDEELIVILRHEFVDMRARLLTMERKMVDWEQRTLVEEARAADMERRTLAAEARATTAEKGRTGPLAR